MLQNTKLKKKNLKNIAIVPARIGSKRIKKKNIKLFFSKPIIKWTLDILKKSKIFDKIVLTSDSKKILKIGKSIGFDILIKRPKALADDFTGTKIVMQHAINFLEKDFLLNNVCCVYPCNPFIEAKYLKKALKYIMRDKNNYVFPITNYSHPIQRALRLNIQNNIVKFINNNSSKKRTQDLKVYFYDAGQFYFSSKNVWLYKIKPKLLGIPIPNWRVIDIDTHDDWKRAEILFNILRNKN